MNLQDIKPKTISDDTIILLDFEAPLVAHNKGSLGNAISPFLSYGYSNTVWWESNIVQTVPVSLFGTKSFSGVIWGGAEALYNDITKLEVGDFSKFTEEFWFKFNIAPGTYTVERYFGTSSYSTSAGRPAQIGLTQFDNKWFVADNTSITNDANIYSNNSTYEVTSSMPTVDTTSWYHYAYQRNGNEFSIFFNGQLLGTWTYPSENFPVAGSSNWRSYIGPLGNPQLRIDSLPAWPPTSAGWWKRSPLIYIDQYRVTAGRNLYSGNFTPKSFT